MEISVIIPVYDRPELLRECLVSLDRELAGMETEVIVIDNASREDIGGMVSRDFPRVNLRQNRENLGFARANNQGLARARGRYLLLLNPDTRVQPGAVSKLIDYLEQSPRVGVVGPRLSFGDGRFQPSTFGFPSVLKEVANLAELDRLFPKEGKLGIFLGRVFGKWFPNLFSMYRQDPAPRRVPALFGACLLVRLEAREKVGDLDPNFFLYWEDADFCYRMAAAGWEVHYFPGAEVVHHGGANYYLPEQESFFRYYQSLLYFFTKHYSPVRVEALRAAVLFIISVRLLLERIKNVISGKQAETEKRLKNLRMVRELYRSFRNE
jgi:GT2 family glycosyltransferase